MIFLFFRCLHYFNSMEKLEKHLIDCGKMNHCMISLPLKSDNVNVYFKNYKHNKRIPFVIYADIECLLKETNVSKEKEVEKNQSHSSRQRQRFTYQQHHPFSVGYYFHCSYDTSLCFYQSYRTKDSTSQDCIEWFVNELYKFAEELSEKFKTVVPMRELTKEETNNYYKSKQCFICRKPFAETDVRVRDHDHFTGAYRGVAHSQCNLNYSDSSIVPIIFHNLSGYDAHFIIIELARAFQGKIDCLPLTKESYISFTKHVIDVGCGDKKGYIKFRFLDSFKFLNSSIDKLSSYLTKDKLEFLKREFNGLEDEKFDLLTRKGVFPYDYVSSYEKLKETCLPSYENFYNLLNEENISESDYAHAMNVWKTFDVKTLGEYSDLYLKIDVLLLTDIFENFRSDCMEYYDLDPTYYYTLPGFTWDAMLKYTGVKLELLTDIDMVLFVERGIRGGVSQCSKRYAHSNNKYMDTYDKNKPSTYLMYFDVNNLYGWAMSQSLPYADFQWVDENNIHKFEINSIHLDSPIGYILEVDLEYPREIHDSHADLPFCPEHLAPPGKRDKKLLLTLNAKTRYVIHYRMLQQCLKHGLQLTKIHRILQFKQSPWLKDYITLNTTLRTQATNEFTKNLFKLLNNAVYGKTIENVRNYKDVKLISHWEGRYNAESLIAKPNFHSRTVFSDDLMAIEMSKLKIEMNKPIYVGMSILDISKERLYEFHYDYMQNKFDISNCNVLYTDTDSLIYEIKCDNIYDVIRQDIDRFDTSDFTADNIYNIPQMNKKIPGLMKDENNGEIMLEFVGLRAKMYSIRVNGKEEVKKIKGIKTSVIRRKIHFDDYIECLFENESKVIEQKFIRSKEHRVFSIVEQKVALNAHDDKRFLISDLSHTTLPWGHYKIEEYNKESEMDM